MDIRLDYFCYEVRDEPEQRLEDAAQQVWVCVSRLHSVLAKLQRAADEEIDADNAGSKMDDLQYHGEAFLTSIYELRERLIFLLAVLTNRDKETLVGRGGYQRRQDALNELRKTKPTAASDIQALENQICSSIKLRGTMTHEAFVHLAMFVEGQGPYEPDNALADLRHQSEASYRDLRQALNKAIERFLDERQRDCEGIEQRVSSLIQAIGGGV